MYSFVGFKSVCMYGCVMVAVLLQLCIVVEGCDRGTEQLSRRTR